jgi:hypothetical protein
VSEVFTPNRVLISMEELISYVWSMKEEKRGKQIEK